MCSVTDLYHHSQAKFAVAWGLAALQGGWQTPVVPRAMRGALPLKKASLHCSPHHHELTGGQAHHHSDRCRRRCVDPQPALIEGNPAGVGRLPVTTEGQRHWCDWRGSPPGAAAVKGVAPAHIDAGLLGRNRRGEPPLLAP